MDNRKRLKYMRKQVFLLGFFKIPMIGFVRPKLVSVDENQAIIRIRLRRRTRNHLKSMYFGAMSVGADLAAGLHTFYLAGEDQKRMSFVFKSVNADFLRRAESDVEFICNDGSKIKAIIDQALSSGERMHESVEVLVQDSAKEIVATFQMTVSVKFR